MPVKRKAAAAALTLLLLLTVACGTPAKPESSSAPAPETSAPPGSPELDHNHDYNHDHDHTLPGLDLPESLPVGDYAFEAYDSSEVQVATVGITLDGEAANVIVLTVPKGTKNFVECYADGVLVALSRLEEGEAGVYTSVPLGSLTGDDQWTEGDNPLKNGDRYDLTFGEAGFFRMDMTDSAGLTDTFFFSVPD